jgi:hypothetical protein
VRTRTFPQITLIWRFSSCQKTIEHQKRWGHATRHGRSRRHRGLHPYWEHYCVNWGPQCPDIHPVEGVERDD